MRERRMERFIRLSFQKGNEKMKIAMMNEFSQASKNAIVLAQLKDVVEPMGHTVYNTGMCCDDDPNYLTYLNLGVQAALLLNSGAVDFVVTGCGTGQGALMALNAFPGVVCGYCIEPTDAYLFLQINNGNALAIPYAKGFGWGAELNLTYIFEKLFEQEPGGGYPKERVVPEQRNKKILDEVKKVTHTDMLYILKNIDQELLKGAVSGEHFAEYFFKDCRNAEIAEYIKGVLA